MKNVLVPKIAEYNISVDQLKGSFQEIFKGFVHKAEFHLLGYCMLWVRIANEDVVNYCVPSKFITFISNDSICFRILSNDIKLSTNINYDDYFGASYFLIISGAENKANSSTRWPISFDFSGTGRSTPPSQCQRFF